MPLPPGLFERQRDDATWTAPQLLAPPERLPRSEALGADGGEILVGTGDSSPFLPTDFIGYPTEGYAFGDRGGRVAPPAGGPVPSNRARQKRDNQLHCARVLEVRIHLPPPVSPQTFGSWATA